MPVEVNEEPGLPVRRDTLEKLERAYNRVMREHVRNGPAQPQDFALVWLLKGKLDGDLAFEGSATVSIWEPNSSGVEADSGTNQVAYDWMLTTGHELVSGARVVIAHIGKRWYVIASDTCPSTA